MCYKQAPWVLYFLVGLRALCIIAQGHRQQLVWIWLECLYAIGYVKHASLRENKLFFHDNSCDF